MCRGAGGWGQRFQWEVGGRGHSSVRQVKAPTSAPDLLDSFDPRVLRSTGWGETLVPRRGLFKVKFSLCACLGCMTCDFVLLSLRNNWDPIRNRQVPVWGWCCGYFVKGCRLPFLLSSYSSLLSL